MYAPRLKATAVLFLLLGARGMAQTPQPEGHPLVVLRAAKLLDVKAGREVLNPVVVIDGERIKEVGPGIPVPTGAQVIDLGKATLMPGLVDAHTHLLMNYNLAYDGDDNNMVLTVAQMSPAERALLGAKMGRDDLEAGITTVRDVGNSGINGDVALRDAINKGWVSGPNIVACTRALSAAGGQFGHLQHDAEGLVGQEYVAIATVDDARRAVQKAFYDGADCIKVIVNTGPRVVSLAEMKAIVEEAHRVHRKVSAHAIGDEATRIAAEAGVDSIEHAYVVPDDVLHMIFEAYRESGMTPWQIIRAATANGAELLGWQERIGSIEAGKFADIVATVGDPAEDVTELERVRFVMKGGEVVRNDLSSRQALGR